MYSIKNNFTFKLVLTFILFGLTLLFVTFAVIFKVDRDNIEKDLRQNISPLYQIKKSTFANYIEDINHKINATLESNHFKEYISNGKGIDQVRELFLTITKSSDKIMQFRYIDKNGMEIIRIDRKSFCGAPFIVGQKALQNKKHRYYFTESMAVPEKEIWYSKIDLNVEHNEIEIPVKPVLRAAMPVYVDGKQNGVIIANIFMDEILQQMVTVNKYDVFLLDKDGYVLVSSIKELNWNRYIGTKKADSRLGDVSGSLSYDIDFNNGQGLKIVFKPVIGLMDHFLSEHIVGLLFSFLLLVIVSIPLAIIFSRYPIRVQKELYELNMHLEERIQKAVEEKREEEKYLLQKNKLENLGQMISMIAHQWRQPLSSINAVVMGIQVKISLGKSNSETLKDDMNQITEYTKHLDSVIETFRNYYRPQNQPIMCCVNDIMDHALAINGVYIQAHDIMISTCFETDAKLLSYENELINVIINISSNAKEAFDDKIMANKWIHMKTYEDDENVVIEISDNAGGIESEVITKIFDPYFSTKYEKNGTGLGLYMSKLTVEEHCKGKLVVHNSVDGAVFRIILKKNQEAFETL